MAVEKYRCVTCDQVFETDADEGGGPRKDVRCPNCHRVHDVVRLDPPVETPWFRRGGVMAWAALLGLGGAALIFYVLRTRAAGGDVSEGGPGGAVRVQQAPAGEIAKLLERAGAFDGADQVVPRGRGDRPVAPTRAGAFNGSDQVVSRDAASVRGKALARMLVALGTRGILTVRDYVVPADPGDRPPVGPADLSAKIAASSATVTSIEAALLCVRIARGVGLTAEVVQVERYGHADVPADPSGIFGHFAAAVPAGAGNDRVVIDPTLPDGVAAGAVESRTLTDDEALAVLDAYRAIRAGLPREDAPQPDRLAAKDHLDRARRTAPKQAQVRLAFLFLAAREDPGAAFAEAEVMRGDAAASEKAGLAEWFLGVGRLAESEELLAEAEAVYPGWYKVPLVRAQIALLRASMLGKTKLALAHPEQLPESITTSQLEAQLRSVGLDPTHRPEDYFAETNRQIALAESMGGTLLADNLRQLYVVAHAEYRMGSGDIAGAEELLDEAAATHAESPVIALPRAALRIARGDADGARDILGPVVTAQRPIDKLMQAAQQAAARIRPLIQAIEGSPSPFDLSAPGGLGPATDPELRVPGLLGGQRRGPGGGLQLRL